MSDEVEVQDPALAECEAVEEAARQRYYTTIAGPQEKLNELIAVEAARYRAACAEARMKLEHGLPQKPKRRSWFGGNR